MDGAALCGFQFGNRSQAGCLTRDDSVRVHSCELGTNCSTLEKSSKVVWVTPLITRSKEGSTPELGAGGGGGDLIQSHELDLGDPNAGPQLIELCGKQIQDEKTLRLTVHLVEELVYSRERMMYLSRLNELLTEDAIPLEKLAYLLSEVADQEDSLQQHDELPLQSVYRGISAPVRNAREIEGDPSMQIVRHPNEHRWMVRADVMPAIPLL